MPRPNSRAMYTQRTTGPTFPTRSSFITVWAPSSTPTTDPMIEMRPSRTSTFPILLCFLVAMIDLPKMCARSVPIANDMLKPKMLSAGVTIQAPPTPKNPPSTPTQKPSPSSNGMLNCICAIGRYTLKASMAFSLFPVLDLRDLEAEPAQQAVHHERDRDAEEGHPH